MDVKAHEFYSTCILQTMDVTTKEHDSTGLSLQMDVITTEHYNTWILLPMNASYGTLQHIDATANGHKTL